MENKLEQISHALQQLADDIWLLAMKPTHHTDGLLHDELVLPFKSIGQLIEKYENEVYERKMQVTL